MRWRTLLALALVTGVASIDAVAQDNRPGVAVMSFSNGGSYGQDAEVFDALEVGLQQMLLTELSQNSNLRIVERGRLNELLAEQDLAAEGRVDANTAARIGRLVGARYVVLGGFIDFYGDFRIERVRDKREQLYDLVVDLSGRITAGLNLPTLPAEVREAREEREIPTEALELYSRALFYQDRGLNDRAIQLFQRVESEFPQLTEASEALRQLGAS
jgi:TolB-like protein